jgi:DNA repair protein RecN (Recombination protein N)
VLHELHVADLGVIADVDLELHPGLNVLTGETGAGKTMITVALSLALGRRASSALVRDGARTARVEARFDATALAEAEDWAEDGTLVLARAIDADGRSTARVSGRLAPVSVLERLAAELVELHGQHESTALRSPAAQTAFLDRFVGPAHLREVDEHARVFAELAAAERELAGIDAVARERERDADVLAFQVAEIEAVGPRPGELAELEAEAARLAGAERLLERADEAERALRGDGAAADTLAIAASALEDVAAIDGSAVPLLERARSLREEAAELARDVRDHRDTLEADPARLAAIVERIAAVRALLRKYGDSEDAVLAFLAGARERAAGIGSSEGRRARLARDVATLREDAAQRARTIAAARARAAPRLAGAIEAELEDLGMADASIAIELVPGEASPVGTERAAFLFSGGRRQRRLPLAKVASGGELSRTMLACRTVLVDADAVPTLVFDEVDSGIGGAAAAAVGRRLAALARERQVLVVTHLPQIASFADRHVVVEKADGTAAARDLDDEERIAELTRMLAGLAGSEAAAAHAQELLAEAGRLKAS